MESLPGAVSIFAKAYQRQTGGTQTGSEAIKTLLAAMKKGQVKGDILTFAGQIAEETAAPGREKASQSSQAQQARFENSINDMAIIASAAGVEEGFARLFKTLAEGIDESSGMIESLAEAFNKATQAASYLLLIPQDFQRLMSGQDSVIADWLWGKGSTGTETLASLLEIRDLFKNIKDLGELSYEGWKKIFDMMDQSQGLKFLGGSLSALNKGLSAVKDLGKGDTASALDNAKDAGKGYLNYITTPGRWLAAQLTSPDEDPNAESSSLQGLINRFANNGFGQNTASPAEVDAGNIITGNQINKAFDAPNYDTDFNPLGKAQYQNALNNQAISDQFKNSVQEYKAPWVPSVVAPMYPNPQEGRNDQMVAAATSAVTNNTTSNVFNLDIQFEAVVNNGEIDFQNGGKQIAEWFQNEIGTAAVNYPNNQ